MNDLFTSLYKNWSVTRNITDMVHETKRQIIDAEIPKVKRDILDLQRVAADEKRNIRSLKASVNDLQHDFDRRSRERSSSRGSSSGNTARHQASSSSSSSSAAAAAASESHDLRSDFNRLTADVQSQRETIEKQQQQIDALLSREMIHAPLLAKVVHAVGNTGSDMLRTQDTNSALLATRTEVVQLRGDIQHGGVTMLALTHYTRALECKLRISEQSRIRLEAFVRYTTGKSGRADYDAYTNAVLGTMDDIDAQLNENNKSALPIVTDGMRRVYGCHVEVSNGALASRIFPRPLDYPLPPDFGALGPVGIGSSSSSSSAPPPPPPPSAVVGGHMPSSVQQPPAVVPPQYAAMFSAPSQSNSYQAAPYGHQGQ